MTPHLNPENEGSEITKSSVNAKGFLKVGWQSPSNIALVKYWGKTGDQIPMNPSLSMTLNNSVTRTMVEARKKDTASCDIRLEFSFEGTEQSTFQAKITRFLEPMMADLPFLKDYALKVESSNTFPHSAGIASSASSMAALALCLLSLDEMISGKKLNIHAFLKKASCIARQGSGSASRSVYGNYVLWGKTTLISKSGNLYASHLPVKIHPVFADLNDSILVIDTGEKPVSSRKGHEKMDQHFFKKSRIRQANYNMERIVGALSTGNWQLFSETVENEALTLHGLMMSSDPGFILIQPNTLKAIEKIHTLRKQLNLRITYTMDAGPNIHLLYPHEERDMVQQLIQNELAPLCSNNYIIHDHLGTGPVQIT
jgi:diphosphomevalonate decarboxylase